MSATAPSKAIVDLAAYTHNLRVVRRLIGKNAGIVAVMKADAYGHGLLPIARRALEEKVAMLGVATVEEGVTLREAGIEAPILILFEPPRDALEAVVEHGLRLTLASTEAAERLGALAHTARRVVPVHCQVDTGMGRQGFGTATAVDEIQRLTRVSNLDIEGIATHFPSADLSENDATLAQIKTFRQILKDLEREGVPFELAHAANSAATVNYRDAIFDLVRPGLMTFGVWPAAELPHEPLLKPVLRWETRVTQVRELPEGATVGYARTWTAPRFTRTAILPVGYADGYPFALSNRADVLIRGQRRRVLGRVCMDQIVVDVTDAPAVQAGDLATLLGSDGNASITAQELADRALTIPYEILAGIGNRVPREYVG